MSQEMKSNRARPVLKKWVMVLLASGVSAAYAATTSDALTVGGIAENVESSLSSIASLMLAVSYISGIGFAIASIFKFKQHKDNPTQIPMGTPLALLVVAVFLIFLPFLVGATGQTFFNASRQDADTATQGFAVIPGASSTTSS